jgi:signal transduction histidine kinase
MDAKNHLILFVDDDWSNRVVFEQTFGRRFKIKTVASGPEALEVFKQEQVAVLVTDQSMPEMTGNQLLLRTKELYPTTVRIVITAYSDLEPILRALNDGLVARYVVKPWNRLELDEMLMWAVEAYDLGRENSALHMRLLQTERLVTLGSIGGAVIHDLNQPLSYLLANVARLKQLGPSMPQLQTLIASHGSELAPTDREALTDLATELGEIIEDMSTGCTLMADLTTSMRRLLQARDGPREAVQGTDPLPIIRYAISVCHDLAVMASGKIVYDGPMVLPKVRIGSTELMQVLINLISNATQALGRKGPGGRVMITSSEMGERVRFVVADDGPGIPPEVLEKIGRPFFSTRPDGAGIGIAQCKRLIERQNGEIRIDSTVGQGTSVTFTLPRA